jgi:glycosyltransferase involved in cell wall biosynthesis
MEVGLVSIIIPVYNRINIVGETIDSAINQTYKNTEILIGDNCSSDGTWELLLQYAKKDSRIRIFRNNENIGPVRNWQKCFENASGKFIKILWSDDLIEPSFISECISFIDKNTAFVITGIKKIDETGIIDERVYSNIKYQKISSKMYLKRTLVFDQYKYPVSPGCAFFRKQDLLDSLIIDIPNEDNLVSSKSGAGPDLLLFLITANKYSKIGIINKSLSIFRVHKDSISVSFGEKLSLAYDWARFYFIQNHDYSLMSDFTCFIERQNRISKLYSHLYSLLKKLKNHLLITDIIYTISKFYYKLTYKKIKNIIFQNFN